jgi:NitT/TauT family transport system substrate-binding protein
MLSRGEVDIVQSAVSSNWGPMERGERDLPVHFAQINQRDGFFLVGRDREAPFEWRKLEGKSLLADHGRQPLVMLKYAAHCRGVDWEKIDVIDAGTPQEMEAAFRDGRGAFVHLQGPAPQQLEHEGAGHIVASVGEAMPPVAFSSLMATREFLNSDEARAFVRAYGRAREWADQAPAREVARAEQSFFPKTDFDTLAAAITRYQELGCWDADIEIPRDLYEQALEVFLHSRAITQRYSYEEVVIRPWTI